MKKNNLFLNRFLLPLLLFFVVGNMSGQDGCPVNTDVFVDASIATEFDLSTLASYELLCVYASTSGQQALDFTNSIEDTSYSASVHFEESSEVKFTGLSSNNSSLYIDVAGTASTGNIINESIYPNINLYVIGEDANFTFEGITGSSSVPSLYMYVEEGAQATITGETKLSSLDVVDGKITIEKDAQIVYDLNVSDGEAIFNGNVEFLDAQMDIIDSDVEVGADLRFNGYAVNMSGGSSLVVGGSITVENTFGDTLIHYSTDGRIDTCVIVTADDIILSGTNTSIANSNKIKLCSWGNPPNLTAGEGSVIDGDCPECPSYEEFFCDDKYDEKFSLPSEICPNSDLTLSTTDVRGYVWYDYYEEYGNGEANKLDSTDSSITVPGYGSYFARVTMDDGCIVSSDTSKVVAASLSAYLTSTSSICTDNGVNVNVNSNYDDVTVYYTINNTSIETTISATVDMYNYKSFEILKISPDTALINTNGSYEFVLDSAESGGCVVYSDPMYNITDTTIYQSPIISIDSSKLELCSEISFDDLNNVVSVFPDVSFVFQDSEGNSIPLGGTLRNNQDIKIKAENNGCESSLDKTVNFGDIDYSLSSDTVSGCVPEVVTSPPTSFNILDDVLVTTSTQVVWSSDVFEFEVVNATSPQIKADSKGKGYVYVTLGSSSCSITDSVYVIINEVNGFENVSKYDCGNGVLLDSSFINNNPDYSLYVIGDNSVEYYLGDEIYYSEDYENNYGGKYYVRITDPYFCRSNYEITIKQQTFDYDTTTTHPSCGGSNGEITWGNEYYVYEWTDLQSNAVIGTDSVVTGLSGGLYVVKIEDTTKCELTHTFELKDLDVFYTKTSTSKTIYDLPDSTSMESLLMVSPALFTTITWSSDVAVFDDNSLSPTITKGGGLGYAYFDISDGTCTYTDSIQLFVLTTPTATDDYIEINEDESICVDVLGNDIDNNELAQQRIAVSYTGLGVSVIENPDSGTILLNNDTVCYTPIPNYYGLDTITYNITDGYGKVDSAHILIDVLPVNDAPYVDFNSAYRFDEDDTISIDILGYIVDVDDDSLSITSFSATNGIVILLNKDSLTYIPYENYNGRDTIFYTVSDGTDVLSHTIPIVVLPVNDAPIANDRTITVLMNTDTSIVTTTIDPLLNDTDVDGDALSLVSVTTNSSSQILVSTGFNNFEYTPKVGFIGKDTLLYSVSDGNGKTSSAYIYINVISSATYAELSFKEAICIGEQVSFAYTSLGFSATAEYGLKIEDSSYVFASTSDNITHTFIGTGLVEVGLNITDTSTSLDTTIIDTIYVQSDEGLSVYNIEYKGTGGVTSHEVGQENTVFSCGTVEASFSSNDLSIYWEGFDLGNEYTIIGQEVVYFDVSDGLCSIIDSVQIEYNNNVSDSIGFDLNTFNASDQVYVRWDDFQSIASARINPDETILLEGATVNIVEEEGEFIVEYTAEESTTGSQEIIITLEDVCGAIKEVSYEFELQYERPLLVIDTITLKVTESQIFDKDSISVALNTDATREITLLDEWSFAPFLEVSVDILSGTHTGISIVALDEFPEFVGEDTVIYVNYKICEVEDAVQIKCDVPGRIPVRLVRDVSESPITLSNGDLDAEGLGLTNRQIRNNIEIIVINSAVTDDVGLSFEFRWNGELINPDSLQYDMTIVSRWNDVVYQETGSGQYPAWNGENKPLGNSQNLTSKVVEGNYFWMMKVDFINENGDNKKYYKHSYLYYKPSK